MLFESCNPLSVFPSTVKFCCGRKEGVGGGTNRRMISYNSKRVVAVGCLFLTGALAAPLLYVWRSWDNYQVCTYIGTHVFVVHLVCVYIHFLRVSYGCSLEVMCVFCECVEPTRFVCKYAGLALRPGWS